jgi:ABC-2 type transport system permease protein
VNSFLKLTWIEIKLFLREPFALIFVFVFPLVVLLVLAGVFGTVPSTEFRDVTPVNYYLASYLGVVIASTGLIGLPVHLATYRERGILRRFFSSSVSPWAVFGAQVAVSFLMATCSSLVLIAVAALAYDIEFPDTLGGLVLSFIIATLSFITLGFLLAIVSPNARAAQAIGIALFFPMWLLSGAGPPRAVMTGAMQRIADFLPLTHVVTAIQDPWLGLGINLTELLILMGILVVAVTLSIRLAGEA